MRRYPDVNSRQNRDSVVVKEPIENINPSFPDSESNEQMPYDLEVQKPAERNKILGDAEFFKKLSLSFYSDIKVSSKSLSPKRYIEINSSGDTRLPFSSTNSDPLANRLYIGNRDINENYTDRISAISNLSKSFQIKSYANLQTPLLIQQNDYFGQDQFPKKTREYSNSRSPSQKDHLNPVRQLKNFLEQNHSAQKPTFKKPAWVFNDPKPRESMPQRFNPYQTNIKLLSPKPNNQLKAPKKIYLDNSLGKDIKRTIAPPRAVIEANFQTSDYKLQANFVMKAKLEQKLNQNSRIQSSKRLIYL